MADRCICCVCDRTIKSNQHAVECSRCCFWVHKGCSGLTATEFDEVCTVFRESKSHNWACKSCSKSDVKRVSLGIGNDSQSDSQSSTTQAYLTRSHNGKSIGPEYVKPSNGSAATPENEIKTTISSLLKKNQTSNKDIILLISKMLDLLMENNNNLQSVLGEIGNTQKQRIEKLEYEISELKKTVHNLEQKEPLNVEGTDRYEKKNSINENDTKIFSELQDRNNRSKNILMYNVPESSHNDTHLRIESDKAQVQDVLTKLNVSTDDFKVIRLGKRKLESNKPRPLKVIFTNTNTARQCLYSKKKLNDSNISVNADLTHLQREKIKKLREEYNDRLEQGEKDIIIKYIQGEPQIKKIKKTNHTESSK